MPREIINTQKTISETLHDIRRVFMSYAIEEFESIPGEGFSYNVPLAPGPWEG